MEAEKFILSVLKKIESLKDGVKRSIEMFPVLNGNFSVDWRDEPNVTVNTGIVQS